MPTGVLLGTGLAALGAGLALFLVRTPGTRSRGRRYALAASLAALALGAFVAAAAWHPGPPDAQGIDARPNPFRPTDASLARGNQVYRDYCQRCHGADGQGNGPDADALFPPPTDFVMHFGSAHTHPDGRLYFWVSDGMAGTAMPGFKDRLSDADRWHVVNYIKTFTPVER